MRNTFGTAGIVRAIVIAVAFALVASPAAALPALAPATEDPIVTPLDPATREFREQLAAKQAELDALEAQIAELDRQLAIASEAYNKSAVDLEAASTRLEQSKAELANAEAAYETQQATLGQRAGDIYRDGEFQVFDLLLGAKSLSDLMARIKFLRSIGESDADIAASLAWQRDQIAASVKQLESEEVQAESLEFELQARQIEVQLRIDEREALLASTQADLLALLESQAAARQQAEAELMRQVLAGANSVGIVVEPGSPVETALSYHGVPYLWGGASPAGFDCSGLITYVFGQHGISLPHYSGAQFLLGEKIDPSDLKPGDVVFFGSPVYHVGMYVGGGYFLHAPRTGDFVKLSKLAERDDYAGARRYEWSYRAPGDTPVDLTVAVQ